MDKGDKTFIIVVVVILLILSFFGGNLGKLFGDYFEMFSFDTKVYALELEAVENKKVEPSIVKTKDLTKGFLMETTFIDYIKDNLIRVIKDYDTISFSEYLEIMKYDTIFNEIYKGQYLVSSLYGERVLRNGDSRFHNGLDIKSFGNKEIHSIIDGTVMSSLIITDKSNPTWEWGNYVRIDDGYGYKIFYCHLGQRTVSKGDEVKKGDVIGIEGNTGYSLEPHLHLEIRKGDEVIHPYEYFRIIEGRN